MADDEVRVVVESIYGAASRRGLVTLSVNAAKHTIPPARAREIAVMLLEAASNAEGDEAVMGALVGLDWAEPRAARFLLDVRRARQEVDRRARAELRRAIAFEQGWADEPTG